MRASEHNGNPRNHVCHSRPPARPRMTGNTSIVPAHGSSSVPIQDSSSSSARVPEWRATSMRPRESEGKAEGLDEDDDGAVRSERSGPQSWARAATPPAPTSGLRHHGRDQKTEKYQKHLQRTQRKPPKESKDRPHLSSPKYLDTFPICTPAPSGIYFKPKLSRFKYLRPQLQEFRAVVAYHGALRQ